MVLITCRHSKIGLRALLLGFVALAWVNDADRASGQAVFFPDSQLEAVVRDAIGKPTGTLSGGDMAALTSLTASGKQIANLAGLEWATNLSDLRLSANHINDLTPLKALEQLVYLDLDNNLVSDVSPLTGLLRLLVLDLSWNRVSDATPLSQVANLTTLSLRGNTLTNIQFLSALGGLTSLNLEENRITDLAPLSNLSKLTYLGLTQNPATNYEMLSGLTNLASLELRGNGVGNLSFVSHLAQLSYLDAAFNHILDVSPLATLTNLSQLVIGGNPGINPLGLVGLTNVTGLWLFDVAVSNISFLQAMPQLRFVDLSDNNISDASPLAHMTNLAGLGFSHNPVSDFSSLKSLTGLNTLALDDGLIGTGAFLDSLPLLTTLSLQHSGLRDLNHLAGLTNLTSLYVPVNLLTNIAALTNLLGLARVDLTGNLLDTNAASESITVIDRLQGHGALVAYDPQNQPPQISARDQWFIPANQTAALAFDVSDDFSPPGELQVSAVSSNPNLVPHVEVVGGTNYSHTLILTPATGQAGSCRITLLVAEDGTGLSSTALVNVTVLFPTNVSIADPDLEDALRSAVGATGDLTSVDLLGLTNLYLWSPSLSDLSGLEWASNLTTLAFDGGSVSRLAPLQGLVQLTSFSASQNYIEDVSPLASLTNLAYLNLSWNPVTNYQSAIAHLPNLKSLLLAGDGVRDLGSLQGAWHLTSLDLTDNGVADVIPLAGLTNLGFLFLQQNLLTNISPLTNLSQLDLLDLSFNRIDTNADFSSKGAIARLRADGANVIDGPPRVFSVIGVPAVWFLATNAASTITFSVLENCPHETLIGVQASSSNTNFLPNTHLLIETDSDGNWSLTLTPGVDRAGQTRITLLVTNDVGLSTNVAFDVNVIIPQVVGLTDPNLKEGILSAVGKSGGNVTTLDLLSLMELDLSGQNVSNLFGLGFATNLVSLNLDNNWLDDLNVLKKLPHLAFLSLSNNVVEDISPLALLTNLIELHLDQNQITNYQEFLGSFRNLTTLSIAQNALTNLAFLTNLSQLRSLDLDGNQLRDLDPLAVLTNLAELRIQHNLVTNIAPLTRLELLVHADLRLNLLDLKPSSLAISNIATLQATSAFVDYYPQREAPAFQIVSRWNIPASGDSSMFFTLVENGQPVTDGINVQVVSTDTNRIPDEGLLVYSEGVSDWVLRATPNLGQAGEALLVLTATNDAGLGTRYLLPVSVFTPEPVAGLFGSIPLTTGGDESWYGTTNLPILGRPVVQSGAIPSGGSSWLEAKLQGPGILTFWWKVSSETNFDFLQLEAPGLTNSISGEVDWQLQTIVIPPGPMTVTWRYAKDPVCCADGLDAGWVADLSFVSGSWLEIVSAPTNSKCLLLLHGALSHSYQLQISADLTHWSGLSTIVATNADMPFVDPTATNHFRFYRLLDLVR